MREVREVGIAPVGQSVRLVRYAKGLRRRRSLDRAFTFVLLALGQRMYAAGIDDGELGEKIANLDQKVRRAEDMQAPTEQLRTERTKLCKELATAALVDDGPLPGADAEYEDARKAQAALQRLDEDLMALKTALLPQDGLGWGRLAIGYGAVCAILALPAVTAWRWILS